MTKHVEMLQIRNIDEARQVTKHAEIPQTYYVDHVVDMPVVMQRQVPQVQSVPSPSINQVTKGAEIPQTRYIDKVVDRPVAM